MKQKKVPMRMCIACREANPKRDMIRIVRDQEGVLSCDQTGKAPGRGAYICAKIECLEKAQKTKAIFRALDTVPTEELIASISRVILRREIGKR